MPEDFESFDSDFFCNTTGPKKDLEPDLFHFNFLGFSGKFVIDRAGNCVPLQMQDIKIEVTGAAPSYSWIITTNDGMKYYFGHSLSSRQITGSRSVTYTENNLDPQNPNTTSNSCGPGLWDEHIATWYLDKIESVNGDEVRLVYDKGQGHVFPVPSYSERAKDLVLAGYDEGAQSAPCFAVRPVGEASEVWHRTITDMRYEAVYLDSIVHDFGIVKFNALGGRTDLQGAKKLESIAIYQRKNKTSAGTAFKKYQFNYDYFVSQYAPADNRWNVGYNDYTDGEELSETRVNSRLKLTSIEDRGNQFNSPPDIPPYEFFYDETVKLPSKTSMSIDHWGYSNGPDLQDYNTSLMPSWEGYQRTNPSSNFDYIFYKIAGADRSPNASYTGACLLKKIKYPTGGFTELEYEANRYKNLVDPYEAVPQQQSLNYLPVAGGAVLPSKNFSVSAAQRYPVSFASVHINWGMSGDITSGQCHATGSVNRVRDDLLQGIGFEAVLTNSTTNQEVAVWAFDSDDFERTGNDFSYNSQEYLNLQAGENYTMELRPTCSHVSSKLPENVYINYAIKWSDYTAVTDKVGGGMRIKQIEDHDGANPTNRKWFEYTDAAGASTGIAFNHPDYMRFLEKNDCVEYYVSGSNISTWLNTDNLMRYSSTVVPLTKGAAGSYVGYSNVVVHHGANDEGGKSEYNYFSEAQDWNAEYLPEGARLFYNQKNGSLLQQKDYKKTDSGAFKVVREMQNTYNTEDLYDRQWIWGLQVHLNPYVNPAWVTNCTNFRAKLFMFADIEQWHYVESTTEKNYDENGENPIVSTTTYEYEDVHYNLIATEQTNSDGTVHRTETDYAFSSDTEVANPTLVSKHMTGVPMQIKQFHGGTFVSGARLKYNAVAANNALVLPTDFYKYEYDPITPSASQWVWKGKLIYNADGYPTELERPHYSDNYIYNWTDGLLVSRHYKDWTWEYNYTNDRLLESMVNMDGLSSNYTYDRYRRLKNASSRNGNVQAQNTYHTGFGNNFIETQLIYSDADDQVTKKLFDGLGRAQATIAVGHGVNHENITTEAFYYDNLGRQHLTKNYVTGTMEQEFEASPSGRVMQQKSYLESGEVTVEYHYYSNNAADEVINHDGGGFYPPNTLYKAVAIDENGHKSISFTDLLGRRVLMRKFVDGEAAANRVDTYTLYDKRGNIKEVISPDDGGVSPSYSYEYNAKNLLIKKTIPDAGTQTFTYDNRDQLDTSTDANGNTIKTEYDDYDRPIRTTLVGTGILSETFYDNYQGNTKSCTVGNTGNILKGKITGSRIRILEQNTLGSWLYTINCYDEYGRIINAITDNHVGGYDESEITEINHADQVKKSTRRHVSSNGNYTINQEFSFDHAFRLKDIMHEVTGGNLSSEGVVHLSHMNYNNKDQLTEKNLHIGTQGPLQSIDYRYNQKGWLTHINDVSTSGTFDPLGVCPAPQVLGNCTTCLPPAGTIPTTPATTLMSPEANLQFNATELNQGLPTNLQLDQNYSLVSITDTTEVSVSQTITINNPVGPTNFTDTVSANLTSSIQSANIDGQVSSMVSLLDQELAKVVTNAASLTKVSGELTETISSKWKDELPGPAVADNDLFGMRFMYDRGENVLGSTPQYNGNISQMFWQVKGRETQTYAFQYDELDRLKVAKYADVRNDDYLDGDQYTVKNLIYDKRGNIKTLRRYGMVEQSATCYKRWQIDDLLYTYTGNQLTSVTDKTVNAQKAEGYDGGGSFLYDGNGNMTRDNNKQMTVVYNHLNLPKKFIFDNDTFIEILYDAAGIKLQKKVYNGSSTTIKDYVGGIEYMDNQLEAIYHEEGRVVPTTEGFRYEYTLKDHLGNARISFSDFNGNGVIDDTVNDPENYQSEILQENHYYPFGMNMKGPWAPIIAPENQYQYNGKELNEDLRLNWLDYGARWYDASIGRWHSVDPLAEKYMETSPYAYVANNPILLLDPDGREIRVYYKDGDEDKYVTYNDGKYYQDGEEFTSYEAGGFLDETMEALQYLSNSETASEMISDLATNEDYVLKISDADNSYTSETGKFEEGLGDGDTEFIANVQVVYFDPNGGAEGGGYEQNPSVGLVHELDHAQQHMNNEEQHAKDSNPLTGDFDYSSAEEKRVIEGKETKTILELRKKGFTDGLDTRKTHIGKKFKTQGPTTVKRKN